MRLIRHPVCISFREFMIFPERGTDKKEQWESEEVYSFLICALCPINGDYIPDEPVEGFLFPAFSERSGNENRIDMYKRDTHGTRRRIVIPFLGLKDIGALYCKAKKHLL